MTDGETMLLPDEIELKTFRVARRGFDQNEVTAFLQTVASQVRSTFEPAHARRESRWWVCTESLAHGGQKILGPFATRALALHVRDLLEQVRAPTIYWIDEEPAPQRTEL